MHPLRDGQRRTKDSLPPAWRPRPAWTRRPTSRCPPAHKTSLRQSYDAAIRHAEAAGAFDTLFFNAHGELTEGGRSNVFVKLAGRWFTLRLRAGLLPGVMRAALLADPAWAAEERCITRDDLARAEEIVVCNALRGTLLANRYALQHVAGRNST